MSHVRFRAHPAIWVGFFVGLACLLTPADAASGASSGTANPHMAQYHGSHGGQYHVGVARFHGGSVLHRATSRRAVELKALIYGSVISPVLHFQPAIEPGSTRIAINSSIHPRIPQSIEPRNGDPRLMLQIGAVLGTIYIVFLATGIWATRVRARPPGRARA
jgi:hypothetical protein